MNAVALCCELCMTGELFIDIYYYVIGFHVSTLYGISGATYLVSVLY